MSFQSPQFGSPGNIGGGGPGLLGFLSALAQGVGAFQQGKQQQFENRQARQQMDISKQEADAYAQNAARQNKLTDFDIQQKQMANAGTQRDQILSQIFTNPALAKDPIYIKKIQDLNTQIGLPTPMTGGSLDISSYQKEFTSLPDAQQKMMLSMPQDQRRPLLDSLKRQGYDIPKEYYKTNAFVNAKDQASLANARLRGIHEQDWNRIQNANLALRRERTNALDAGDMAKVQQIDARTTLYTAQAAAIPQKLALDARRVANDSARLQLAVQRFHQNPTSGRSGLTTMLNGVMTNYTRAQGQLNAARLQYENLLTNGADPSDPQVQMAQQTINGLQDQLEQLSQLHSQAIQGLQSGISGAGTLSASSGMSVTPVSSGKSIGKAPAGVPEGDYIVRGRKVHVDSQGNMSAR